MTLAALAVLTVQALTALGCTVRAYRVGRGRIREVAELTPITPRQALFALVDWPMYKVLGFAAMIGVIAAAAGLGDVEIPDSHSGLDLVLDAISWALALTWAAYRIVQCAVFRAFATMRHYAYHASAGVFLLWMAVEFNWGSEAAHWLVLLSVTLLLHCTLFLPGHRTASDTAVGAVPKEATSR